MHSNFTTPVSQGFLLEVHPAQSGDRPFPVGADERLEVERLSDLIAQHMVESIEDQNIVEMNTLAAYKTVAKKKCPVSTTTKEETKPVMIEPTDMYGGLPDVCTTLRKLKDVPVGERLTTERLQEIFPFQTCETAEDF